MILIYWVICFLLLDGFWKIMVLVVRCFIFLMEWCFSRILKKDCILIIVILISIILSLGLSLVLGLVI